MSISTRKCAAPGCMENIKIAKRHFFKFPKDRKRWLEWVKACNRTDLEKVDPEYTNQYYHLCHLHFRIDMFKNIEGKVFLNKEAVPSIFLESMQAENNKSGNLVQPLSFVTIFLKPESENKNLCKDLSTLMQSEVLSSLDKVSSLIKSDEENTLTVPTMKVLFPRQSIKQTLEDRKYHVSMLEKTSENDNRNTSTMKLQLVKDVDTNSAASISPQIQEESNDNNIIDLSISDSELPTTSSIEVSTPQDSSGNILNFTNSDFVLPTTSTIVPSTHSTPQHSNGNILNLTNSNSVLPITSSTIVPLAYSTPQHDNRIILNLINPNSVLPITSSKIVSSTHSTPQYSNGIILNLINPNSVLPITSPTIVSSTHSTPQHSNGIILNLTNPNSVLPITSPTIVSSTHSTPQHSNGIILNLTNPNSVLPITSSTIVSSTHSTPQYSNGNSIDLTNSDFVLPTTSTIVPSTHSTPQHSNGNSLDLTNSDSVLPTTSTIGEIVPSTYSTPQHSNRNSLDLTNLDFVLPTTSTIVPSTHSIPQHSNGNSLDLTNLDFVLPTTSTIIPSTHSTPQHSNSLDLTNLDSSLSTTLSHSTPQHDNRTPKRKHWHISTQTPEAWLYIDSFLRKKQMEKFETCADNLAAKRRKVLGTEEADQHLNVEQVKTACTNLLPRASALLLSACIDAQEKRKNGKDFDRQFALRLFFTAPIAYRSYRTLCLLPTARQLWRYVRSWDMPPGLNDNILNALRLKMKSLPPLERRCCLCVREMQLQPHLFYNSSRDRVVGFYEIGTEKRRILARKALVVMARSLAGDWEQPVAYYFHGNACNAGLMKNLIFQAIIKLTHIGATVHALITGTASTFVRLSQRLGISAECPWFLVNDEKIFYIFDVTRLMRVTRNVLMTHEICFNEKKASWADIELFFRRDSQMRLPLTPELSVSHVKPNGRQKIETKYAVEVFSSRVAAGLSAYVASGRFSLRAIGTAEFVYIFDQLYNILNSSASTEPKKFGRAFTGSVHETRFLQQTLDFLKSIRVVDGKGAHVTSIKCFDRWQVTINAITQLWDALKEHQFSFLRTRRLNHEGIDCVFRSIKQQSGNRARPTPILFTRAFKNLVSKHLFEHSGKIDDAVNAQKILKRIASSRHADRDPPVAVQTVLSVSTTSYRDIDLRLPEKSAFKRVCEFLLAECLRAHGNCDACVAYAKENSSLDGENAPGSFNLYISSLADMFMRIFEQLSTEENVGARMLQHAQQIEYKPPCPDFPVTFLIKLFLRMRMYFTLLRHNRICRGQARATI